MIPFCLRRLGVNWEVDGEDIISGKTGLKIEPDLGNAIPEITPISGRPSQPTLLVLLLRWLHKHGGSVLFHDGCTRDECYFTDKWFHGSHKLFYVTPIVL